jgi:3-oxoisoapionate decarboxylase
MRTGIDSYSFHRYFGEVYPDLQEDPGKSWTMEGDFVDFAREQGAEEVALETCFFSSSDPGYIEDMKARVDDAGFAGRVVGWGHPDGLHAGSDEEALADLKRHIPIAQALGAPIMRIVSGSMIHVEEPHGPQIENTVRMLSDAVEVAREHGVVLAIENHIDFTSEEILRIVEGVGSDHLRVNFDTGNTLRLYEDPVEAARRLAPYTVATHTKDIITLPKGGSPAERFTYWPSAPCGEGLIDLEGVAKALDEGGFDGALCVEIDLVAPQFAHRGEEDIVSSSLQYLRTIVPNGAGA